MSPFLTASGRWVFLVGVCFVVVGAGLGDPLLILFGQIPIVVLLVALASLVVPARAVERRVVRFVIDQEPVGTLRSGQSLTLPIWCENPSKSFIYIKELSPYLAGDLEAERLGQSLHIVPGQARRFDLRLMASRIGRGSLQGFDVVIQDRFGLLGVRDYLPCVFIVESFPPMTRAERRRARLLRVGGEESAGQGPASPQVSGELRELRDYQPGDALRTVAWKATVRQRRLITQEFEEERSQIEVIALDISSSMRAGTPAGDKFEHALRLVSELSGVLLEDGYTLGLWSFGESVYGRVELGQGEAHGRRIQRHLVLAKALVAAERTAMDEVSLEEFLADYLHVQERLDFRRRPGSKPALDRDLLNRWLRAVNRQDGRGLKQHLSSSGVSEGQISEGRRFLERRGFPLAPPSELRPGAKGSALNQVLREILIQGVGEGRLTIVSDLCGLGDLERVERALKLLRRRGMRVRVLAPFTPFYGEGASVGSDQQFLRDLFTRAEVKERQSVAERLTQVGVEVSFVGPDR